MPHGPLDADAAVGGAPGVGVQDVHELAVVSGQGALVVCVLEGGAGGIQTWRGWGEQHNGNNMYGVISI